MRGGSAGRRAGGGARVLRPPRVPAGPARSQRWCPPPPDPLSQITSRLLTESRPHVALGAPDLSTLLTVWPLFSLLSRLVLSPATEMQLSSWSRPHTWLSVTCAFLHNHASFLPFHASAPANTGTVFPTAGDISSVPSLEPALHVASFPCPPRGCSLAVALALSLLPSGEWRGVSSGL